MQSNLFIQLLELFDENISKVKGLSSQMLQAARLLLTNKQGGPLAQMTISPTLLSECKTLGSIVIHTASVVSSKSTCQVLLPFFNMLTNPAALTVSKQACMHSASCITSVTLEFILANYGRR